MVEDPHSVQDLALLKFVVVVLTFASGILGVGLSQSCSGARWQTTFSLANSVAAGVLLAAGLVCMLPDAMEGLPKGWPSIFAGIAIFSLLCVEELAMVCANASGSADSAKTVTPNTLENGTVAKH